jgi:pyruvate kinase
MPNIEGLVSNAEKTMLRLRAVKPGDVIAIVAGTRTSTGSTNFLRLHVVGAVEPPARKSSQR